MIDEVENSAEKSTELSAYLHLLIQINNTILTTVSNLEKLNIQLCNMVSNINNIKFVCNKQCDDISESL